MAQEVWPLCHPSGSKKDGEGNIMDLCRPVGTVKSVNYNTKKYSKISSAI